MKTILTGLVLLQAIFLVFAQESEFFCLYFSIQLRISRITTNNEVSRVRKSDVCLVYGLFIPRTVRTLEYSYHGWTIRMMDDSYDGRFVPPYQTILTEYQTILTTLAVGVKEYLQAV